MRITNYKITTTNDMSNIKIALFSDIHYSKKDKRIYKILKELEKVEVDFVCIPGDLYDYYTSVEELEPFIFFIKKIAKTKKVILSLGNHDLKRINNKDFEQYHPNEFIKVLNEIENVYLLDNKMVDIGDISFYGLTIPFDCYFDEDLMDKYLNSLKIDFNNKYNILLCHNPEIFTKQTMFKNIKGVDIILSGHMHNGLIPFGVDKLFKTNRGIISPTKVLFPKYTRGLIKVNNNKTTLIISKGIKTFHSFLPLIVKIFNFLYPMNIEYISIS